MRSASMLSGGGKSCSVIAVRPSDFVRIGALFGIGLGAFALVRLTQNDPAATDAVVAIAALASSIAAVLALLQSEEVATKQVGLAAEAHAGEVRRALPLLGLSTPQLNKDGSVRFIVANETGMTAINVNLYVESRGAYNEVLTSEARSWPAIPTGERKQFVPEGVTHPWNALLLMLTTEGILGGTVEQTWVAKWDEGTFGLHLLGMDPPMREAR